MVEGATLKERLQWIVDHHSRAQVVEWAGATEQALSKWLNGGGITDDKLRAIANGARENYFDLLHGQEWREAAAKEMGPEFPVDPASEGDTLEVYQALPPRYREMWVAIGRFLVYRYAPASKANPFPGTFLPTRLANTK